MIRWGHFWALVVDWARRNGFQVEDLTPTEAAQARDLAESGNRECLHYSEHPRPTQRQPDEVQ